MDLIDKAKNRNRWRALVNATMNLLVPYIKGISRLAENLLASQ
jgi:hypothetical protein